MGASTNKGRGGCFRRTAKWGCGTVLVLVAGLVGVLLLLLSRTVPSSFPLVEAPIVPPDPGSSLGGGLHGFESPYIGHTGSWDGKGGAMFGAAKVPALEAEAAMGLRWTFMCVYWRALEPDGPVDPDRGLPPAWASLDAFVVAAQLRGLNILMQAPVVGGNAGGPPTWAGRREPGASAPEDMEALAGFAGKLAMRYAPGGTLARAEGWGTAYGVRAWELDNEPASYRTHWKGQAADYAEFATAAAAAIRQADPQAVILAPALASGAHAAAWLEQALDADGRHGSPAFRAHQGRYSLGPVTEVVSFHNYEGLDTFFAGEDLPVTRAFSRVRSVFETGETRAPGFEYPRKQEYWHTEGNFDFLGLMSERRRAAWRIQFFTRAFAAGIRKVTVMDAKPMEQIAVRTYVQLLPDPFPMVSATNTVAVLDGRIAAFRHEDRADPPGGQVWVVWAVAGTGPATVEIPVAGPRVEVYAVSGQREEAVAAQGRIRLSLSGDEKMSPPLLVVDR